MKALVTGAAGFIGSHLTERLLAEGYQVSGVDSFLDYYPRISKERNIQPSLGKENFNFIEANLLELHLDRLLEDVDFVFHQAAQAGVRASWGDNFQIYSDNNILVTQLLLEAAARKGVKKFVYASSSSVYGDSTELPLREDSKLKPVSPYGVSKLAAEDLCYLYWKNYSVPTVSLRYFTVFGERQRPDMAFHIFIKAILEGKPLTIFGDGKQSRNFTHVDDIVEANLLAAASEENGQAFNIGGEGEGVVLNEAIRLMEQLIGQPAHLDFQEKVKGDVRHTSADCSKARELLGYSPGIPFKEGLQREIDWLKEII